MSQRRAALTALGTFVPEKVLTNADLEKIVGNAVFLASTSGTVNVLAYTQYSDNGGTGEAAYTDRSIDNRAFVFAYAASCA